MRSLRLLEHEWIREESEGDEVRYALETLRGRESRERTRSREVEEGKGGENDAAREF